MSSELAPQDPRGQIPLAPSDRDRVRVLSRSDLFADAVTNLPEASVNGFMRIRYGGLVASKCRCSLIVFPIGQGSPPHGANVEHIIVVLNGAFDFMIAGERHRLEELDQIFIPAGATYEIHNVAPETSWFLSFISPLDGWPTEIRRP